MEEQENLEHSLTKTFIKPFAKQYCSNCNKIGHIIKHCSEPITSIGIFCFKLNNYLEKKFNDNIKNINYYDFDNNNNLNISNILKFNKYNTMIQFLLVRRKHSLNYIDFIRGKYDTSDYYMILNMFNHMSKNEVNNIKTMTFDDLWNNLWNKTANNKLYNKERKEAYHKFTHITNEETLNKLINECNPYDMTEWEIPKGRRDISEKNLDCAIREFNEETALSRVDYNILNCIDTIHDNFICTNNK